MRIAFVLPIVSPVPVGGYKVVYEYANLLVARGHRVAIAHSAYWLPPSSPRERLRRAPRLWRLRRDPRQVAPWMELDPRVELSVVADERALTAPECDVLLATSWVTAPLVAAAPAPGRYYLIQGYETWGADAEAVRATWRLPLEKITVSRWLEQVAIEMGEGERTHYVPIGLRQEEWGVDRPIEGRPARVGVAFSPIKDSAAAIAALLAARERLPELSAVGFGTGERPADLPAWADYVRRPDPTRLREVFNSCSLFLQANGKEGWGLPAAEAMACGCALVTYDTGGSREYAEDGHTAVVVEEASPATLASELVELWLDPARRLRLAVAGGERVRTFTWSRSVAELERILLASVGDGATT